MFFGVVTFNRATIKGATHNWGVNKNILTFNLTQKQLTHTVHIVFIYFTLLKVMK